MKRNIVFFTLILFAAILNAKNFTVVIDPGHGGKDPGAIGKRIQEKAINLNVALMVGKMIEEKHSDVDVVYTRKTDKYLTLQERPNIANQANGDLFISIHTNASESSSPYGAETYTLGLSKSNANFEVSKRENSVLLLEEGNKETYQGFDPTSPESYIMFEMMQSQYIDQSVQMAYYVQKEFTEIKRLDRGVRQAIFWVLHQVKMPSILVELGFITNSNEETFLASADGQKKLAVSIVEAFDKYKHEYDKRTVDHIEINDTPKPAAKEDNASQKQETKPADKKVNTPETKPAEQPKADVTKTPANKPQDTKPADTKPTAVDTSKPIYKIQVFCTKAELGDNAAEIVKLKKLGKNISHIMENGWCKYMVCQANSFAEITKQLTEVQKAYKDAFIVAFDNGKKITVQQAQSKEKK